jgi:hypothetical protein
MVYYGSYLHITLHRKRFKDFEKVLKGRIFMFDNLSDEIFGKDNLKIKYMNGKGECAILIYMCYI